MYAQTIDPPIDPTEEVKFDMARGPMQSNNTDCKTGIGISVLKPVQTCSEVVRKSLAYQASWDTKNIYVYTSAAYTSTWMQCNRENTLVLLRQSG